MRSLRKKAPTTDREQLVASAYALSGPIVDSLKSMANDLELASQLKQAAIEEHLDVEIAKKHAEIHALEDHADQLDRDSQSDSTTAERIRALFV